MTSSPSGPPTRTAFLLSQVGALVSSRFAERTREIGLTPSDAGVLRLLGRTPGVSQRSLADKLGAVPSRVVTLIDSLEQRGLVERKRSSTDRRNYELHLTPEGDVALGKLRGVAQKHEKELLGALTNDQISQLKGLLEQIARSQGLDMDIHSGTSR